MFCFAHTPTFYLFIQFLTTGIGGLAFAFYSSWRVSQNDELMSGGFGMLFVYHGGGCMENVSFSSLTQPDLFYVNVGCFCCPLCHSLGLVCSNHGLDFKPNKGIASGLIVSSRRWCSLFCGFGHQNGPQSQCYFRNDYSVYGCHAGSIQEFNLDSSQARLLQW
jgi:hypothetical protein